jgi:hypothetical protein
MAHGYRTGGNPLYSLILLEDFSNSQFTALLGVDELTVNISIACPMMEFLRIYFFRWFCGPP